MAYWEHSEQRLFWEMNVSGLSILVRSGTMGNEGELRTIRFTRDVALQTAFKRIAKEKESEGYRAGIAPAERNLALEEAILRDPDDEHAFLVYADWLQAKGDPRGEFISVQHAIAHAEPNPVRAGRGPAPPDPSAKGREQLSERATDLETLHLARLPWGDPFRYRWRMGFLDSVEMYVTRLKTAEIATRLSDVLSSPAAPFVRAMSFISHHPQTDFDASIAALAEKRLARALLALTISGPHGMRATLRNVTVVAQRGHGFARSPCTTSRSTWASWNSRSCAPCASTRVRYCPRT